MAKRAGTTPKGKAAGAIAATQVPRAGSVPRQLPRLPPALKALLAQLLGLGVVIAVSSGTTALPIGGWSFVFTQGAAAALAAAALRSAPWWLSIHLVFAPALLAATRLQIAPAWYLAAFGGLVLVYWSSFRTQVPLFLSNRATAEALSALIPQAQGQRVADLGSGTGGLLLRLARSRPDCRFIGIEAAPLPFAIARLTKRRANLELRWGDFWSGSLAEYDLVYAFLSPVPMARLWEKAHAEMRPGSLLVSNSFPVPDLAPTRIVDVADRRRTRLYCYRL
jgi:hypothetical protein